MRLDSRARARLPRGMTTLNFLVQTSLCSRLGPRFHIPHCFCQDVANVPRRGIESSRPMTFNARNPLLDDYKRTITLNKGRALMVYCKGKGAAFT